MKKIFKKQFENKIKVTIGVIIAIIVLFILVLLFLTKYWNIDEWNNFWNVFGNVVGSGLGIFGAYLVANWQFKRETLFEYRKQGIDRKLQENIQNLEFARNSLNQLMKDVDRLEQCNKITQVKIDLFNAYVDRAISLSSACGLTNEQIDQIFAKVETVDKNNKMSNEYIELFVICFLNILKNKIQKLEIPDLENHTEPLKCVVELCDSINYQIGEVVEEFKKYNDEE